MIAPVKKFGRVRLSTNFPWKQIWQRIHGRTMSFCSVISFPAYKYQEKVSMNFFNGLFGHQEAWCMNSSRVMLEIIVSLWRENSSRDLKTELLARVLELCSRSEMLSWSSVWVEFRSSSFTRIDVGESFKCRTEYRILKYEHVKKYALMEWRIKATENWLYIQHLVTGDFTYRDSGSRQAQLFLSFVNFRATISLYFLYFSTYSGCKTLFVILNTCYEHNVLVWVLQQSYVNFH